MSPWKLPIAVVAIVVPIVAAFYLGGPGVGIAIGALAAVAIVAYAVAQRPRGRIGTPPSEVAGRHLLIVVSRPVEDEAAVRELVAAAAADGGAEVLVLAPVHVGFLDRWASDVEGARREAQQSLVITVASLAKAGLAAEARVGDENLVQAVEDQLNSFPATEVILVGGGDEDPQAEAAAELERRLRAGFRRIVLR